MHFKFTFFSKHVHLQPVPIFFQIYVCYFGLQGIQGEPGEGGLIGPPGGTVCLLFIDDTVELRLSRLFGTWVNSLPWITESPDYRKYEY